MCSVFRVVTETDDAQHINETIVPSCLAENRPLASAGALALSLYSGVPGIRPSKELASVRDSLWTKYATDVEGNVKLILRSL